MTSNVIRLQLFCDILLCGNALDKQTDSIALLLTYVGLYTQFFTNNSTADRRQHARHNVTRKLNS